MNDAFVLAGRIRKNLVAINDYYAGALRGAKNGTTNGGGSSQASGEPVNLHAVDVRLNALNDLRYWTRFVLDEVNGGTITNRLDNDNASELVAFLNTWALALAEQMPDDAANLDQESHRHGLALRNLALGWATRRTRVSKRCPEMNLLVSTQGLEELVPCEGELWSTIREVDNGLLPRNVLCDRDPAHVWEAHDWLGLGKRLGRDIEGITA